jgi:hypothetical protein
LAEVRRDGFMGWPALIECKGSHPEREVTPLGRAVVSTYPLR